MTSEYASYLGVDLPLEELLPLEEAVKQYRDDEVNALTVMCSMHKAGIPQCVIDLFQEQHGKLVTQVRESKKKLSREELTKEDVLSYIKRATFEKTDDYLGQFKDGLKQVFLMPKDNPFREDYDDGGGAYRLEKIYIEYTYDTVKEEVNLHLKLCSDIRVVPGCQGPEFELECLDILFEKQPRLDNRAVSGHVLKVRRDKLKQIIYTEVENSSLPMDDVALVFEEVLRPER
jgi:hypothetical protein